MNAATMLLLSLPALAGCEQVPVRPPSALVSREVAIRQADQFARAIGGQWWNIQGTSMRPFLSERSIVVTEPAHFDELQAGDVVLCRTPRLRTVIHRLLELRDGAWVICGDANLFPDDERVTRANYLGRQCAVFFTQ